MSEARIKTVARGEGDQRLDRWLKRLLPQLPQSRIERLCRRGEVRLNGRRVKPSVRLEEGQEVRMPPIISNRQPEKRQLSIPISEIAKIKASVIHIDDQIIALNKPPGLAVQGGSRQTLHLDGLLPHLQFGLEETPRLVHRLDKETSGVLLLARSRAIAAALTAEFRHRETKKIYWALVDGVPKPASGRIQYGLVSRLRSQGGGQMICTIDPQEVAKTEGARNADTLYYTVAHTIENIVWLALQPKTGRKHQLRVHLSAIGHPILGDSKYGIGNRDRPKEQLEILRGKVSLDQLHLHARSLQIKHPVTRQELLLCADLPVHMRSALTNLGYDLEKVPSAPFGLLPNGRVQ
ncbi:MAG: RluA family pseudouridine synthase [Aestuariivita sp.]|nr:RluA family pseudouridine synthase [Aestuariivita sp.]MCY4202076.1 RluA family pseudouridine synthase [Aestuariivita sp.]